MGVAVDIVIDGVLEGAVAVAQEHAHAIAPLIDHRQIKKASITEVANRDATGESRGEVALPGSKSAAAVSEKDLDIVVTRVGDHEVEFSVPVKVRCGNAVRALTNRKGCPFLEGAIPIAEQHRHGAGKIVRYGEIHDIGPPKPARDDENGRGTGGVVHGALERAVTVTEEHAHSAAPVVWNSEIEDTNPSEVVGGHEVGLRTNAVINCRQEAQEVAILQSLHAEKKRTWSGTDSGSAIHAYWPHTRIPHLHGAPETRGSPPF